MNFDVGGLLNNVGLGAITGMTKAFKREQEEQDWLNQYGWFGSLINAQKKEHEYMARNKERIPMILEYMTGPLNPQNGKYSNSQYQNDTSNRKAITMYINPSRLQFNNQKLTQKSVTRGGIFYHHWGDDHTIMSLSGDLGLSSMSGVKKLDEVYRMSGNLLAYGENSSAPVYWDGNTDLMNDIMSGNWEGAATKLLTGKMSISDFMSAAKTQTIGAAMDAITGRRNNGLQSNKVAQKIGGATAGALQKVTGDMSKNTTIVSGDGKYTNSANNILGGLAGSLGEKLGGSIGNMFTNSSGCLDYLDENVVKFADAFGGFSDIMDELEDPWRPRLVWIYFEDHVYIGHFQSFNYTRDASSVNIHYEMSFVIQREVILTSFQSSQPSFIPAQII